LRRFNTTFFLNEGFLFFHKIQNIKMKHLFLTFSLCITTLVTVQAQKIELQKLVGSYKFKLNDKNISLNDMAMMMEPNPEAFKLISTAQVQNAWTTLVSGLGGGLIGWELGGALVGKKITGGMIGAGALLIVISIPINNASMKNALKAVELYNAGLKTTSLKAQPTLQFVSRGNGAGLVMTF
jgi:hypothetical protein